MIKHIFSTIGASIVLLAVSVVAHASITSVPEPFQGYSANSTYSIKYDDVNELLKSTVVNTGRRFNPRAREERDPFPF